MFSRVDRLFFLGGGVLATIGLVLMATDPVENGFGILTLWIAPPILVTAFFLPVLAITGRPDFPQRWWRKNPVKHIAGLVVFFTALVVYLITLEPTASLWDCSEFIASSYKLQVPHTPGTPLSLLIGRIFTMLAFGDVERVAWTLNFMSGLFSAMTVWLLFHITHHLADSAMKRGVPNRSFVLISSSCVAALVLAFSDTFWFSAVEAETYGAASFFLLLLAWLILTGSQLEGASRTRRMILIFYLSGLAYCIHPMCLLALPMLPFVWFAGGKKVSAGKMALLLGAGLVIVFLINRFVAIGLFELAFYFDRFFVNNIGLPFYSGVVIMAVLIILCFRFLLARWRSGNCYTWSVIFLLLGFAPYLMLFIRSGHNPPIDEGNPENLALIKAYMNRESYPSSPLLYGPYFDARIQDVGARKKIFYKDKDVYRFAGTLPEYQYDSRQTLLPRMYSNDPTHVGTYRSWSGLGENESPRFYNNLQYLFKYQLGHMYLRYLLWNFAGRAGDVMHSAWLVPWDALADSPFERARNQYWMIPLLMGIIGAVFQLKRDPGGFLSVTILFLITGLVLALYLNAPPGEPRERDYIYVGSFISFCIWIGLGMVAFGTLCSRIHVSLLLSGIVIPLWMLYQNFDDHDRSGRTLQVDSARNTLSSCAPNAILFTGGDNDTFPLWYVQEVEGYRTDVRVMVLSYMNTDWYINQLRKAYYDSEPFHLMLDENDYRQYGANDVLYVQETIKEPIDAAQFLRLLKDNHPALSAMSRTGEPLHILPSRRLKLDSSDRVAGRLPLAASDTDTAGNEMVLHITEDYLPKSLLAIVDLILSNRWQRPVYFNFSSLNALGVDISGYVSQEGPVFRLQPFRTGEGKIEVDTRLSYQNLVVNADYSNLLDNNVYFTYEDHFARIVVPARQAFNDLAAALLEQGDREMALNVLVTAATKLYPKNLPPSFTNIQAAEVLIALERSDMAAKFCESAFEYYFDRVKGDADRGLEPSRVDLFVAHRAAAMLAESGDERFMKLLADLTL